jgi:hypothetical protein
MWKQFALVIIILTALISGLVSPLVPPASPVLAQPSSSLTRAEALVIVNSNSACFSDFQHFIQPYLDHSGIPYSLLDIATTPIDSTLSDYALMTLASNRGAMYSSTRFPVPRQSIYLISRIMVLLQYSSTRLPRPNPSRNLQC